MNTTYEELKQRWLCFLMKLLIGFEYYLWGIETFIDLLKLFAIFLFEYYLWGIETKARKQEKYNSNALNTTYEELKLCIYWPINPGERTLNTTYEELKLILSNSFKKSYNLWILPMRNWNTYENNIFFLSFLTLNTTYEELKLALYNILFPFYYSFEYYLWGIETNNSIYRYASSNCFEYYLWGIETL